MLNDSHARVLRASLAALIVIAASSSALAAEAPSPADANQIVAKVNKEIITRRDVERQLQDYLQALEEDPVKSPQEKLREYQALFFAKLREMITERLTVQLGKEAGLSVPEDAIEARIAEQAEAVEGLPRLVQILGDRGMTLDDLRLSFEEDALTREVFLAGTGLKAAADLPVPTLDTYVGPRAMGEYYQANKSEFASEEAIKVSMIFVSKRRHGRGAEERAQEIHRRALSGESFAALARQMSDHSSTGKEGGVLAGGEWMAPDASRIRPEFNRVVWGLPRGGISDLLEIDTGWFIYRIDDKQLAEVPSYVSVQDRIKQRLQERRFRENVARLQRQLLDSAYIWPESLLRTER
jgi:parvulin-like peptidyl-prolyl isomerase